SAKPPLDEGDDRPDEVVDGGVGRQEGVRAWRVITPHLRLAEQGGARDQVDGALAADEDPVQVCVLEYVVEDEGSCPGGVLVREAGCQQSQQLVEELIQQRAQQRVLVIEVAEEG